MAPIGSLNIRTFLFHIHGLDFLPVENFNGYLVVGGDMLRQLDLGKSWATRLYEELNYTAGTFTAYASYYCHLLYNSRMYPTDVSYRCLVVGQNIAERTAATGATSLTMLNRCAH